MSKNAPIAPDTSVLEIAEQALSDLRENAPAMPENPPAMPETAPLTEELQLGNGVALPAGFVPPPGFDISAFKPDATPAPTMPSTEELMAQGAAAVEKDNAILAEAGITGLEPWMNNPTYDQGGEDLTIPAGLPVPEVPSGVPEVPSGVPEVPSGVPAAEAVLYDITDPLFVQSAAEMGLTPQELAESLGGDAVEAPSAPAVPVAQTPAEAALQAQLEAMQAQIVQLTQRQQAEAEAAAIAQAEAQSASSRADYEANQRAIYEAQFEHLDDVDREAIVEKSVEADLLRWDSEATLASARAQSDALARQQSEAQREAQYSRFATDMVAANPTMALEVAPGFRLADFVTETHRAACDAYGAESMGEIAPYAAAFEKAIKDIQTKAIRHGISLAQAKLAKTSATPPVVDNRGGGGSPTNPPIATSDMIRPGSNQLYGHLRNTQARR